MQHLPERIDEMDGLRGTPVPGHSSPIEVFISYSHDSTEHANQVLALANQLTEGGIFCYLDQWEESPPEGWPMWMDRQIRKANFVLMICTETYFRRVMGEEEAGVGLGVIWEGTLIYQYLYNAAGMNIKFIPILLYNHTQEYIPTPVQGATRYSVHHQGEFDRLYRRLRSEPESPRPPLGQLHPLPARDRIHGFFPGVQPALSKVPFSNRAALDIDMVGRDSDAQWLQGTSGDCLVVGSPGSGKTFLLADLAKRGWGLFVVSDDLDRLRAELERLEPQIVIVDDAHFSIALLRTLIAYRQATGARFSIVAASWPGSRDEMAATLGLSSSRILDLPLLTRDQIVSVVHATGLGGPPGLIREIVDQAEGKPGLAVTLSMICLKDGVRDIALGDALSRALTTDFQRLVGSTATTVLAACALGGDAGMPLDAVSPLLGLSLVEAHRVAAGLAAGGVISDVAQDQDQVRRLAVRPRALREVLVRDVFFQGAATLPYAPFIAAGLVPAESARALIGAKERGANVPFDLIVELLQKQHSKRALTEFAWSGPREAEWVLSMHPELVRQLAHPLLFRAPELAIPVLLDAAVGDSRPLPQNTDHPLRLIEDWIEDTEPGNIVAIDRRMALLNATVAWITLRNDPDVGTHALAISMNPKFERHSTDPGRGMTVSFRFGPLPIEVLREVFRAWPRVVDALKILGAPHWRHLLDALRPWVYPTMMSHGGGRSP
jgi:hypothetical protein